MLLNKKYYLLVYILGLGSDFVVEVGAVKGAFELMCIHYLQVLLDVRPHFVGSGGCQGDNRGFAYLVDGGAQVTVFGAEVVPPF